MVCYGLLASLSTALHFLAHHAHPELLAIYSLLTGVGIARAFQGPAVQSMLPSLVHRDHFGSAVAWNSTFGQAAMVLGPALGGIVCSSLGGARTVYAVSAAMALSALVLVAQIESRPRTIARPFTDLSSLLGGVRYVTSSPIVFGAISLDLFAVLLGGATALLPVYARDILHLGPSALGVLRSAPAIGGATMAVVLALRPIRRHVGRALLLCVALFGVGTMIFGVSRSFIVSLAALIVLGAADMVSVFVRSSLVQLATPEAMRGRVSAISMLFIGASNELGEVESGVTAQWFGTVPAVVLGGIGTLVIVVVWSWLFPSLRRVDRLSDIAA